MAQIDVLHRLRVHDAGTTTPGDGTVDFTLADLANLPVFGGQQIRPNKGSAQLGRWSFDVVDLSGALTGNLANGSGRSDVIGRLIEVQENRNGAGWGTVNVGRLTAVVEAHPGRMTVEVRDERWKERNAKPFTVSDTCHLWPPGPRYPWRNFAAVEGDTYAQALVVETVSSVGSARRLRLRSTWVMTDPVKEWIRGDVVEDPVSDRADGSGNFEHIRLNVAGTDYEVISFGDRSGTDFVGNLDNRKTAARTEFDIWVWAPSGITTGLHNAYLWAPTAPPSETLPLHLGTHGGDGTSDSSHKYGRPNPWDLVEAIYTDAGVRYDSTAFDALRAAGVYPNMGIRITDPDVSARELVEEQIYAPLGVVPFIDDSGRVAPASVRLPHASVFDPSTAFELDESNCASPPTFDHSATTIVNRMTIEGVRFERAGGVDPVASADLPADLNRSVPIKIGPQSFASVTQELGATDLIVKALGVPPRGEASFLDHNLWRPYVPTLETVAGWLIPETFDRYGDGAIEGQVYALREVQDGSGRTPEDLNPGDLCRLNIGTFPNLATNSRGGVRIVQIMGVQPGPGGLLLTFLDAGPNLQPLATPTISIAAGSNTRHQRNITVGSIPAGARAQVRVGFGAGSEYTRVLDDVAAGVSTLDGLPSGTQIRVQVRAVAPNRVRSDWSTVQSSTTSTLSAPTSLSTTQIGRAMKLEWTTGVAGYPVMPVLRTAGGGAWTNALTAPLPPGSTSFVFGPQAASTSYDWGVRHVDQYGGEGTVAFSTASTSTARQLAAPVRVRVIQGRASGGPQEFADPSLVIGYGIHVGFSPVEASAAVVVEVSTDSGFSSIDQTVEALAGATSVFVFLDGGLDETLRYIRLRHRRDGMTDSDPSDIVTSLPTALVATAGNDSFPGGFVDVTEIDGGLLQIFIQSGGDPNTDGASYDWDKNPAPEDYPTVDGTSRAVTPLPVRENLNDNTGAPPTDEVFADGDVIMIRVRFSNSTTGFGQEYLIRHVYGGEAGIVSLDRIEWYNPTSGPFAINVARLTAHLRVPSTVQSYRSVLKYQEWNGSSYDSEVTYTVDEDATPTVGVLSLDAPASVGSPKGFLVKDRINSWELTLYDDTGGGAGSGTSLATTRVVTDILRGEGGAGQVALYSTDGSGDVSQSTAVGFGSSRDGDGVFEVAAGAIVRLKDVYDAGNQAGASWTPDYSNGAAQIMNMTGDVALQLPSNWGTARPMNIRITTNGNALTFASSTFYASSDGPSAGDLSGVVFLSIELADTGYVVTALLSDLTAL